MLTREGLAWSLLGVLLTGHMGLQLFLMTEIVDFTSEIERRMDRTEQRLKLGPMCG